MSIHGSREATETCAVNISFCGLTPAPVLFHSFHSVTAPFSVSLAAGRPTDEKYLMGRVITVLLPPTECGFCQSALVVSPTMQTQSKDVLRWLRPCSSCSSNYCVTFFFFFNAKPQM
ncbi:hypothetical protein ILYODFUR_035632 [Ilyodon furcidens]|uniref:Uncharacterized protein n=1 Tax=Ilyodon furcidens TaxID=33524 RepID=A0ABV0V9T1_9TELE